MATKARTGSRNGIEWRTAKDGVVSYRWVLNTKATGKVNGDWTTSNAEAKAGRVKALGEAATGVRGKSSTLTLRAAWDDWFAGASAGTYRTRSGDVFKPSSLRSYERRWKRIDPDLGAHRLDAIRRADLQALIDRWGKAGLSAGTINVGLDPVRAIYRWAIARDLVTVNPTTAVETPRVDNARERFATREEAASLIAALPIAERAIWATAFYGGLRRGELRALRWSDVDLAGATINVKRGWDDNDGEITPKSKAAVRRVPIVVALGDLLRDHQTATARAGADLVFGRSASQPFVPSTVRSRALAAWSAANAEAAKALGRPLHDGEGLQPIGLHEARHTCASLMIAARANAKALSVVLGHESITITFDRYGKLMPGGEGEVGRLLDVYLSKTDD